MIKVLFVCHGNICRSPMAEFLLKDIVQKKGIADQFYIASAATSTEEIGNGVHYGTRNKLARYNIRCDGHHARQMTRDDYAKFDLLIGMDSANVRNMTRIAGGDPEHKIHKMLEYVYDGPGFPPQYVPDVADPWYTDNFDETYDDISRGLAGMLKKLGY